MKTIMIVDDEPLTRMDLSDMLRELGFEVVGEAADGFDAIVLCRAKHPDIVLMDVRMPVFDGLTASATIFEEDLAGCIVLLTAFSDQDLIDRAAKAGVTGYLVKPIDQKALLPTLEIAYAQGQRLRSSQQQAEAAQQRIRDDRQIRKAQQYLARTQRCSESDAYRQMRKMAMDKRMALADLAAHILRQAAQNDDVAAVKGFLMTNRDFSDERAYRYIVSYGRTHGCSVEEAARQLKAHLMTAR